MPKMSIETKKEKEERDEIQGEAMEAFIMRETTGKDSEEKFDFEQQKKASEKEDSEKIEEIRKKFNGTDNKEAATLAPEQHKNKIKLPEWRIDEEVRNMSHTDEMKMYSAAMDLERIMQELNLLHNEEKMPSFEYDKSMRGRVDEYNKKVISLSGKIEGDRQREIIDMAKRKMQFQISGKILRVNSFDKLYENIKKFSSIDCSDNENRLPKKYISLIEDVRNKKSQIESIPEIKDIDANIKNKIKELMKKDVGPGLPPDTEWLTDEDIKEIGIDFQEKSPYSMSAPKGFEEIRQKYLKNGESGLETEYGQVNGFLVWCDGNIAVFETPQGKIIMPFRKLMHPSGKTYEQIENERISKEHRDQILNSKPESRYVEN